VAVRTASYAASVLVWHSAGATICCLPFQLRGTCVYTQIKRLLQLSAVLFHIATHLAVCLPPVLHTHQHRLHHAPFPTHPAEWLTSPGQPPQGLLSTICMVTG
jgi:hypothetical protein